MSESRDGYFDHGIGLDPSDHVHPGKPVVMTGEELQQMKRTLIDLSKQMPLGFNDSETAVTIAGMLAYEVERLRGALDEAYITAMNNRTRGGDEERRRWYRSMDGWGDYEGLAPEVAIERFKLAVTEAYIRSRE